MIFSLNCKVSLTNSSVKLALLFVKGAFCSISGTIPVKMEEILVLKSLAELCNMGGLPKPLLPKENVS
jgi:hypothetical protein